MPTRNKHYDVILKWADGAKVQMKWPGDPEWRDCVQPGFSSSCEYRVKPEPPKPEVRKYRLQVSYLTAYWPKEGGNVEITFEDKKLVKTEVIECPSAK